MQLDTSVAIHSFAIPSRVSGWGLCGFDDRSARAPYRATLKLSRWWAGAPRKVQACILHILWERQLDDAVPAVVRCRPPTTIPTSMQITVYCIYFFFFFNFSFHRDYLHLPKNPREISVLSLVWLQSSKNNLRRPTIVALASSHNGFS